MSIFWSHLCNVFRCLFCIFWQTKNTTFPTLVIDLLLRAFLEVPFSTMAGCPKTAISVNGAFPLLNGPFSDLIAIVPFPLMPLMGRFPSCKSPGKQPTKKRSIKRFLTLQVGAPPQQKRKQKYTGHFWGHFCNFFGIFFVFSRANPGWEILYDLCLFVLCSRFA